VTAQRRVALKVDCDTFQGTKKGLPNFLRLFDEFKIRASFFFTLGPDNSGRAIVRVLTRKGFLRKMLRSNAAALYGPRTVLYGTLLPAPMIGLKCAAVIRSVGDAGHETGVHAWDHVRWHDRLDRMGDEAIARDYGRAHESFASIFGRKARSSAAPGWHATAGSLRIQKGFGLLYASDTRGGEPCFLKTGDDVFDTLEIPTTLPTWDEALAAPEFRDPRAIIGAYRNLVRGTEVHSIHTEVEGTAHLPLFRLQLEAWRSDGIQFVALEDIAREQLAVRDRIPVRSLIRAAIPNRGGDVSSSVQ
jgi:undecaprenyl phosphate-alpha-L-ara4FN deformylase